MKVVYLMAGTLAPPKAVEGALWRALRPLRALVPFHVGLLLTCCGLDASADDGSKAVLAPTVGMEGQLSVKVPGSALEPKPIDPKTALVVRIAEALPRGNVIEYDLRFVGMVPGTYDLRTNLVRTDGSSMADVPAMPVSVLGLLPRPHSGALELDPVPPIPIFGSYRRMMTGIAILWVLLAVPWFLSSRRRRRRERAVVEPPRAEPTLAERMRPLVEQAAQGTLSRDGQAQLERMLLHHWRQRMDLESKDVAEALAELRAHPEAGVLLRALEDWLHRRPGEVSVDLEAVLKPYGGPKGES